MAGIVIFLLVLLQKGLHFGERTHRQRNGNELAALLGIDGFRAFLNGLIGIFLHRFFFFQVANLMIFLAFLKPESVSLLLH